MKGTKSARLLFSAFAFAETQEAGKLTKDGDEGEAGHRDGSFFGSPDIGLEESKREREKSAGLMNGSRLVAFPLTKVPPTRMVPQDPNIPENHLPMIWVSEKEGARESQRRGSRKNKQTSFHTHRCSFRELFRNAKELAFGFGGYELGGSSSAYRGTRSRERRVRKRPTAREKEGEISSRVSTAVSLEVKKLEEKCRCLRRPLVDR